MILLYLFACLISLLVDFSRTFLLDNLKRTKRINFDMFITERMASINT